MNFVDLHSHVLWDIDDGPTSPEDSLEMLHLLSTLGFSTVCATPHQKADAFVPSQQDITTRFSQVQSLLSDARIPLSLQVAAENFWDELFLSRAQSDSQPSYRQHPSLPSTQATPAFLLELPIAHLPPRLSDQLFAFRLRGRLPVLAHPERYMPLWDNWDRLAALSRCAALVVDLAALDGAHGPDRARAARHILKEGLCHAVASDVHQPADLRPVAAGIQWIKKKLGTPRLNLLLSDAPRQILGGELPDLPA